MSIIKTSKVKDSTSDINVSDAIFDLSQTIPEERKKKLFDFVMYRFDKMRTYRTKFDEDVKRWEKIYDAIPNKKDESWQSNLFVPYTYSIIQTILPRIYAAIFGNPDYVNVSARTSEFLHAEQKIAAYLQQKLDLTRLKQEKASQIILAALKYPYVITKTLWKYSVDTFTVKKQIKILGGKYLTFKKTKRRVVTYDDPDIELIDWFDFWIDPNALTIDNARDCVHRTWKDYNYLYEMSKIGIYSDVKSLKDSSMAYRDDVDSRSGKETEQGYTEIELLEYWGQYDINGDGEEEFIVVTVANREKIVRIRLNDLYYHKKPFTQYKALPEPFKFEGKSVVGILESLQNELNDVRNQRMDNTNLSIRKFFKVARDADIDIDSVFSGPGNTIFVEDMDDIEEFKVSDVTGSIIQAEPLIKEDMQQVSGSLDYTGKGYNTTATGISIITSEMATRFKQMVIALSNSLEAQFHLVFQFLKQFKVNDEAIRIYAKGETKFENLSIREIEGDYFFTINVKDISVNRQLQQQQWVNLLNILGRFDFVNVKELTKSVLDVFEVKNADAILDYKNYQQEVENLQLNKMMHLLKIQTVQQAVQQQLQAQQSQMQAVANAIQQAQTQEAGGQEIQAAGQPAGDNANVNTPSIEELQKIGLLRSPVDPTLQQPIKKIPELEALKQSAGLNQE